MITVTIYPKKRNTPDTPRSWGIRIQGGNGKIIGHNYNDPADAVHAVNLLFGTEEVVAQRVDEQGNVTEKWPLR